MQDLALANHLGYTLDEISELAECSKPNVCKMLKSRNAQPIGKLSTKGRAQHIYGPEVLEYFNVPARRALAGFSQLSLVGGKDMSIMDSSLALRVTEPKEKKLRGRNSSAGRSRKMPEELEARLIAEIKKEFLENGRQNALHGISYEICARNWDIIRPALKGSAANWELKEFAWYIYNKRIIRKDGKYTGPYHNENWKVLWNRKHKVNQTNARAATEHYDYVSLFMSAGEAGPGYGAGSCWAIDGTQLDVWVKDAETKKPKLISFLCIMDALTGMPLYFEKLDKGETIDVASRALYNCARIHGAPRLGVVLDNGRAFASKEVKKLIASWYDAEELEEMATNPLRLKLFKGQKEPAIYPLPKIPRFAVKAKLERLFDELNKFGAAKFASSYQGSTDRRRLSHETGSTPTLALNEAKDENEVWAAFLNWIYTSFIRSPRPASFQGSRKLGFEPTIAAAWQFFGGKLGEGASELPTATATKALPEDVKIWAALSCGSEIRVTLNSNHAFVTRNKTTYDYVIENAPLSVDGQQIRIAQDLDNPRVAYFFKEYDERRYSDLTPYPDDIAFLGTAYDSYNRSINEPSIAGLIKKSRINATAVEPEPEEDYSIKLNPKKEIFLSCAAQEEAAKRFNPAPEPPKESPLHLNETTITAQDAEATSEFEALLKNL